MSDEHQPDATEYADPVIFRGKKQAYESNDPGKDLLGMNNPVDTEDRIADRQSPGFRLKEFRADKLPVDAMMDPAGGRGRPMRIIGPIPVKTSPLNIPGHLT